MLKASLRVAFVGLMVSFAFAACGNDSDDKTVVAPPAPTPTPTPTPNPTAFTFGNACSGQEGECGADGSCFAFAEGATVGMCTGVCGSNDEAGWTLCADNQTGNLGATAACLISDEAGDLFCGALCGSLTDPNSGEVVDYGVCDAQFTCQLGALEGDGSVDLSQLGICG